MGEKTPITATPGMHARSRWIWLAILGTIAGVLAWLLGSWTVQAQRIDYALECGAPCLTSQRAKVSHADTYTQEGAAHAYSSDTVEYRVWLDMADGTTVKVSDVGRLWPVGERVVAQSLDGRVVAIDEHKVWDGWGSVGSFGVLLVLLPIGMVCTVGVVGQVACLATHYLRRQPSHQLQTFSAMVHGFLLGEAFAATVYFVMDAPWFFALLAQCVAIGVAVIELVYVNWRRRTA